MSARLELADSRAEAAALANLVASVADSKYFLAHRLARWGVGAPALESAVACTAIAQEEAGTPVGCTRCWRTSARAATRTTRSRGRSRAQVRGLVPRGGERFMVRRRRRAGADRLRHDDPPRGVRRLAVAELRKRADRILADEGFHRRYVEGRLRELGSTPAEASILEDEVAALLPETLCWFGPPGEPGPVPRRRRHRRTRQRHAARALPGGMRASRAGLRLPETGELPWERWSSLERRLNAGPAPATRSRVRGARRSRSSASASSGPAS